jgi:hypothetical protein
MDETEEEEQCSEFEIVSQGSTSTAITSWHASERRTVLG